MSSFFWVGDGFAQGDSLFDAEGPATGSFERFQVTAAAECFSDVSCEASHIGPPRAHHAHAYSGKGELEKFEFVDGDPTRRAFEDDSASCEAIESFSVVFEGGDHGWNLFDFSSETIENRLKGFFFEGGDVFLLEDFAGGVVGGGGDAKSDRADIFFFVGLERLEKTRRLAETDKKDSGRIGVEGSGVSGFGSAEGPFDERDSFLGRRVGWFVDVEEAVHWGAPARRTVSLRAATT